MKLIYQSTDILQEVSINRLVHDMYAEKQSDSLEVRFNDPKSIWEEWDPQIGNVIELEEKSAHTGIMYISSITAANGFYTVRALSMPPKCKVNNNKSWEGIKFSQIAQEIAERHGMECELYEVEDQKYSYMVQDLVDDLEFLQRLCELEGCAILAYNGKIVIYDEKNAEKKSAKETLSIGLDGVFQYSNNSSVLYRKSEVRSGCFKGNFEDSSVETARVFMSDWPIHVNSDEEAARYAKNLLRLVNKNKYTGTIEQKLILNYAPASIIELETIKAKVWNSNVFVTRVRHDYTQNTTKLCFRKPLEGY